MSNEHLGIYEELRARARRFEARKAERKRMLNMGPAYNGAAAQQPNPFERKPRMPVLVEGGGGFYRRNPGRPRRGRQVHSDSGYGVTDRLR